MKKIWFGPLLALFCVIIICGCAVEGQITFEKEPVVGLSVSAVKDGETIRTTTDNNGKYEFLLIPGQYTISPSTHVYTFENENFDLSVSNKNVTDIDFVVTGREPFSPADHGFTFINGFEGKLFPRHSLFYELSNYLNIEMGSGLCGGMVFAALDYYQTGIPIPDIAETPNNGELYNDIWYRQLDVWGGTEVLPEVIRAVTTNTTSTETDMGKLSQWMCDLTTEETYAKSTEELFKIKNKIDKGEPVPILVLLKSNIDWNDWQENIIKTMLLSFIPISIHRQTA